MKNPVFLKETYNIFHKNTKAQFKIIERKNYTYRFSISVLNEFAYKSKDILDIGCGSGTIDFYLAKKGGRVFGVDISRKAIKKCKESAIILGLEKKTTFKVINFPRRSIDRKFDIIICFEVLEHLEDDFLAARKIKKMIKRNGLFVLSVPSKNAPLYKWGVASKFDKEVGHLRRYSVEDLQLLLSNAGFKIIKIKKVEGVFRNFLFMNRSAGKLIRFLKFCLSDIATVIDNALIPLFGESNIIIVARPI